MFNLIRSLVWRISRKFYCLARKDLPRNPNQNGEYWLISEVINNLSSNIHTFIDIGAHLGNWSEQVNILLSKKNLDRSINLFEPANDSYQFLRDRFKNKKMICVHKFALSDTKENRKFFIEAKMAGTNSLYGNNTESVEMVNCTLLDDYLSEHRINFVTMVKCDAEGNDFKILKGAANALKNGCVEIWQFEYNHRWLYSRTQLKDVFEFIADKPYTLGKLYNNGIETYDHWHPELERFFEANYVLVRQGSILENLCRPAYFNSNNILVRV